MYDHIFVDLRSLKFCDVQFLAETDYLLCTCTGLPRHSENREFESQQKTQGK